MRLSSQFFGATVQKWRFRALAAVAAAIPDYRIARLPAGWSGLMEFGHLTDTRAGDEGGERILAIFY